VRKRIIIAAVVVVLVGALGAAGWWQYKEVRHRRIIARGRSLLEKKDYEQAELSIFRVLQMNPRDLEANRMMVELTEATGAVQDLHWRHMLVQLEPNVLENHLDLAECALRLQHPQAAEQALANVSPEGKKTAAYHNLSGRVALALKDFPEAEVHFVQAVELDPKNEQFQLDLALIHLRSPDPKVRSEARSVAERIRADSKSYRDASRALLRDAAENKDWNSALSLAKKLQSAPDAPFADQLVYLELLRNLKHRDYQAFLGDLQEQAAKDPKQVASLMSWMNRRGLNIFALEWSKRLPEEIRDRPPVSPAIAEAYANLHDWVALKAMLNNADWREVEFTRCALLALVFREEGDLPSSRAQWESAVRAAGDRPEVLATLAEFATDLKWDNEVNDLLWAVARGPNRQQWALAALSRKYSAAQDTRALLAVTTRALELDPQDLAAKSQMASLLFQTNASLERARVLAREAYEKDPKNPKFAATYAYALHSQAKTEEGIKIMRSLPAKLLETPPYSIFHAVLLANVGEPDEAYKFIELAEKGNLVPEQTELLTKARMSLRRRGFTE